MKQEIRLLTRTFYSMQLLRVEIGNRVAAYYRSKMGEDTNKVLKDEKTKGILKTLVNEYVELAALKGKRTQKKTLIKQISGERPGTKFITTLFEYDMLGRYCDMIETEIETRKALELLVKEAPIWKSYLSVVHGCGPLMCAVCVSELDPYKAPTASSFIKYAGLDVVRGVGRGMGMTHRRKIDFIDSRGRKRSTGIASHNVFLKGKLMGVLSTSFLRTGKGKYNELYYKTKAKYKKRWGKKKSKAHIDMMARRYIVKAFLHELWAKWRELEGLDVTQKKTVKKH